MRLGSRDVGQTGTGKVRLMEWLSGSVARLQREGACGSGSCRLMTCSNAPYRTQLDNN